MTTTTIAENSPFSPEQLTELAKPLDPRFVSVRKGGSGRQLKYLEGHDAIDQANRIFGHGNWAYKPVSVEQVVIIDPLTGEAVGIEYKAIVSLVVRGAVDIIEEIGSQPVATWNVEEQVMSRRESDARYNKTKPDYDAPITWQERKNARNIIMEAHEMAKKGAVTDALKRCLRVYGNQFGNGLYGDGPVDLSEPAQAPQPVRQAQPARQAQPKPQAAQPAKPEQPTQQAAKPAPQPVRKEAQPVASEASVQAAKPEQPVSTEQFAKIKHLCKLTGKKVAKPRNAAEATALIKQLQAS